MSMLRIVAFFERDGAGTDFRILVALVVVAALAAACRSAALTEPEVSKTTFAGTWPFTAVRGRLACEPGKMITFTTGDRTYAVNETAKRSAEKRGWLDADYITAPKRLGATTKYAQRVSEGERRYVFAKVLDCEDRFDVNTASRDRCKADLMAAMQVTAEEVGLIRAEGLTVSWPPLKPRGESVADIIGEGLKLCK